MTRTVRQFTMLVGGGSEPVETTMRPKMGRWTENADESKHEEPRAIFGSAAGI
jgi:hypothetical protein